MSRVWNLPIPCPLAPLYSTANLPPKTRLGIGLDKTGVLFLN